MTELYTYSKLDSDLQSFITAVTSVSHYYSLAFQTLYDTGCRPSELFSANAWQNYDSTLITLQPLKGNGLRYIEKSIIDPEVVSSIEDGHVITSRLSLPTLQRYFQRLFHNRPTFIHSTLQLEPIGIYLFRHFAFKSKFAETGDRAATGQYFGEVDIKNTNGYIDSSLFYTP